MLKLISYFTLHLNKHFKVVFQSLVDFFLVLVWVCFLYIFRISLSSWHMQLLGVAASWAVRDSPCRGMCARMIPMGYCCHPTWLCHPMGGGPFLR